MTADHLFDDEIELPDNAVRRRYEALLGLDDVKLHLARSAEVLLDRDALPQWSKKMHDGFVLPVVDSVAQRTPLFVLAGDVGTGKTSLAESFAHPIADERDMRIIVLRLSLKSRGTGAVGEMTRLLGEAFDEVVRRARGIKGRGALVLVIDEADAIAQSRELGQMHHEDRAGVNALIRGIDQLSDERLPAIVVMCTNRLNALDPAVRRRAAAEFEFERPTVDQAEQLLAAALQGSDIGAGEIRELAKACIDTGLDYPYTFSDIVNRLLPAAVLQAYPDKPLTAEAVQAALEAHRPTPPFQRS